MRVFLNKHAAYGTGGRRWAKIERALRPRLGEATVEEICSPEGLGDQVRRALDAGERTFVAAGGDGTVNLLLNALMCSASADAGLTIGAVGLGSSNDFHKPLAGRPTLRGVPLRVAVHRAAPADVIRLEYHAQGGRCQTRYCLINASIGVTAEANHAFNTRGQLLRAAQKLSVEAAIVLAALKTIAVWQNIPCTIKVDDNAEEYVAVTNLGIFKNPHFAGRLCYDTEVSADDGKMGVSLCEGMTTAETVGVLLAMYRRRLRGRPGTRSWVAGRVFVKCESPFALEGDGEVMSTTHAELSVVPQAVSCCP